MSGARWRRVGIGDRVLVAGKPSVVVSVTGTRVRLADEEGTVRSVTTAACWRVVAAWSMFVTLPGTWNVTSAPCPSFDTRRLDVRRVVRVGGQ